MVRAGGRLRAVSNSCGGNRADNAGLTLVSGSSVEAREAQASFIERKLIFIGQLGLDLGRLV